MTNYIKLNDCIDRRLYRIDSRNLDVGVFDFEHNRFLGLREKFGDTFVFAEYHYDTGVPFGTVRPEADLGVSLPKDIALKEYGDTVCAVCRRPVVQYAYNGSPEGSGPPFYRHSDDPDGLDVCRNEDDRYGRAFMEMNIKLLNWLLPYDRAVKWEYARTRDA